MTNIVPNSGAPLNSELTFEQTVQQTFDSLDISDDNVALEDPEEIILSLSALSSKCKINTSIGQMQVTILDDDGMVQMIFLLFIFVYFKCLYTCRSDH